MPTEASSMLAADASDPIVRALIGGALGLHREELTQMQAAGVLHPDVDIECLARSMASTGWSVILMWMKGYVALHDFKREYTRDAATRILPWLTPEAETRVRVLC